MQAVNRAIDAGAKRRVTALLEPSLTITIAQNAMSLRCLRVCKMPFYRLAKQTCDSFRCALELVLQSMTIRRGAVLVAENIGAYWF